VKTPMPAGRSSTNRADGEHRPGSQVSSERKTGDHGNGQHSNGKPVTSQKSNGKRRPGQSSHTRLPSGIDSVLGVLLSSAVVLDSDDRVLRASAAAREFGLVDDDSLVVGELLALVRQVRREGETREGEIDVMTSRFGGRATSFAVRVAPLGPSVGDGGLVLLLAEDQTESRRVDEVRRDFVANISHELKTPVGALALLAETVEEAAHDPEAVLRFAGRMRQEASRLTDLVQDLIMLSRIQAAEPVPDPTPVKLDSVIAEALDRCRMRANARGIVLERTGELGVSIMGDEDLLVTALRNLLENAVAYSPDRTRVHVEVRRVTADTAAVQVTDQGIGIPEHELERIFERFYRVDPARSRATGGTGLGLAIVKHVIQAHGGKVTVWSKEGGGSTFTLLLPMRPSRVLPTVSTDHATARSVREAVK
jgi:two-component system, OmpR family, sensor histidine kinase SenX3